MFCIRPLEGCFAVHVLFAAPQPGPAGSEWAWAASALGAVPELGEGGGGLRVLEEWARPSRAEWAWSREVPPRPA